MSDEIITSEFQPTIEANHQKFESDSERSYVMTAEERRKAKLRKREQRARIAEAEAREKHTREVEAEKLRIQQRQELTGLASWNETAPGVQAAGLEEQFQCVLEFAKKLGPFSLGETAGHFASRVYQKWLSDSCPLLDRVNNWLVRNLDRDAVLTLEGIQHGDASPLDVIEILVKNYLEAHSDSDEFWGTILPIDVRAMHLVKENSDVQVPTL